MGTTEAKAQDGKPGAPGTGADEALSNLRDSLARTDPLLADAPGVRDVVTLLRWHGEAQRALGKERARRGGTHSRALEAGLLHAFLVLSRPVPRLPGDLVLDGIAALRRIVSRTGFHLALAGAVLGVAFLVGFLAVDVDSRFGDLLLLESRGGLDLGAASDPVGGTILMGMGARTGSAFLGEIFRLLTFYALFVGGLLLGVPPALALAAHGARLGSLAHAGTLTGASGLAAFCHGLPDLVALVFACAAGFAVAHRLLATGVLPRIRSLGAGLRDGVGLLGVAVAFHGLTWLPRADLRAVATTLVLLWLLAPLAGRRP